MVAVKLWGGLGNQMFQYAFGLYIAQQRNDNLAFYQINTGLKDRPIDLLKYNVDLNLLSFNEINKYFLFTGNGKLYRFERWALKALPELNKKIIIESSLYFNPQISKDAKLFDGYWQSYKYLESSEERLRSEFVLKEIPPSLLKVLKEIKNENSVSLHIRRGDYSLHGNNDLFAKCDEEYYSKAIKLLTQDFKNLKFYLFSDDIKWVSLNLRFLRYLPLVYVDNNAKESSNNLDLYLMSRCKHNIIANSTFSWWAAWLNPSKDKVVIAPKNWYNGKLNDSTIDLIPETWMRI